MVNDNQISGHLSEYRRYGGFAFAEKSSEIVWNSTHVEGTRTIQSLTDSTKETDVITIGWSNGSEETRIRESLDSPEDSALNIQRTIVFSDQTQEVRTQLQSEAWEAKQVVYRDGKEEYWNWNKVHPDHWEWLYQTNWEDSGRGHYSQQGTYVYELKFAFGALSSLVIEGQGPQRYPQEHDLRTMTLFNQSGKAETIQVTTDSEHRTQIVFEHYGHVTFQLRASTSNSFEGSWVWEDQHLVSRITSETIEGSDLIDFFQDIQWNQEKWSLALKVAKNGFAQGTLTKGNQSFEVLLLGNGIGKLISSQGQEFDFILEL